MSFKLNELKECRYLANFMDITLPIAGGGILFSIGSAIFCGFMRCPFWCLFSVGCALLCLIIVGACCTDEITEEVKQCKLTVAALSDNYPKFLRLNDGSHKIVQEIYDPHREFDYVSFAGRLVCSKFNSYNEQCFFIWKLNGRNKMIAGARTKNHKFVFTEPFETWSEFYESMKVFNQWTHFDQVWINGNKSELIGLFPDETISNQKSAAQILATVDPSKIYNI